MALARRPIAEPKPLTWADFKPKPLRTYNPFDYPSVEERMRNYIEKPGPLPTKCWIWQGQVHDYRWGYGSIKWNGQNVKVHRASYMLHVGDIPEGMLVCHHCDEPLCINPDHLFLGTDADNNADMVAKGRHIALKGSDQGCAILKEEQVAEILRLSAEGRSTSWIVRRYGVAYTTICDIIHGRSWAHVPGPRKPPAPPPSSSFRGVVYSKTHDKWFARLWLDGKTKHLGIFKTEIEAARCVNAHVVKLGLNRALNEIPEAELRKEMK
jgi:hypothetical protein